MLTILNQLRAEKAISELNYQFARLIAEKQVSYAYSPVEQNLAILLAALVSYQVGQGNIAISLVAQDHNFFGIDHKSLSQDYRSQILQKIEHIPPLEWQNVLEGHIAFSQDPKTVAPMIFQNDLLYFYRYWQAENRVANYLQQAAHFEEKNTHFDLEKAILAQLFPHPTSEIDWQKVAVATALRERFCVISGGPGTGKTTTVAKLLAALQEKQLRLKRPMLNIALVAPTGKAAARLKESLTNSFAQLHLTFEIPTTTSTLHRLLGIHPHSDTPIYHLKNPLHLDLLVVDEASMIDLSLMEKLINALKPTTRLILLGDKDQLASVEAGAMMGELGQFLTQGYSQSHCDYLNQLTGYELTSQGASLPICDALCHLRKSHRFNEHSGIGRLAAEVNAQQAVKSWQLFTNTTFNDLERIDYPPANQFAEKQLWIQDCVERVVKKAVALYRPYLTLVKQREKDPKSVSVSEIFEEFQRVRFLSALRGSELGVERLNQQIADALQKAKLIQFHQARERYIGKPILITQNAPQNGVYNGDIGIILPDEEGNLRVYFDTKIEQTHFSLSLSRVPVFEPAYVMTVHKSQGSEFDHTLLIMPLNTAPVVTKELIYTAITRAKNQFTLFGEEKIWKQGVKSNVQRQSGLAAQLKGHFTNL